MRLRAAKVSLVRAAICLVNSSALGTPELDFQTGRRGLVDSYCN